MNILDIIIKKRDGGELSEDEIRYFVKGYTEGAIPDYQASALMMAIYFRGMTKNETYYLTSAMTVSGDVMDLSGIDGVKVDKHSTGGVGDKTTLCVAPLAAASGVKVAKMAGRGLGHTGGTIDKLESFPGFNVNLSMEEFKEQVNRHGIALMAQTGDVTPADKKLYALRDVTGTVENLSLIASSIMSKKVAAGSDAIVLDVKTGSGAFMKTEEDSEALAREMIEIGKSAEKKIVAVISDMDQPLGNAVGNALEVKEAIDVLRGAGPEDITELSLTIAGIMCFLAEKAGSLEEGKALAEESMRSGAGLDKLKEFVEAQGGDPAAVDDTDLLAAGSDGVTLSNVPRVEVRAWRDGFVHRIDALATGNVAKHIGAGRETKEDEIDLLAGIVLNKKVGDSIREGELLATLYGRDEAKIKSAESEMSAAFTISGEKKEPEKLIKKIIG